MKLISVVTPCYNEEGNVEELYRQIQAVFAALPEYEYEQIFIDNASMDRTVELVKGLAAQDKRVKLIVNTRNFGHIRSPYYALLQARGAAVIAMASDLQDPPTMIPEFLRRWEEGYKLVVAVKAETHKAWPMRSIRRAYYRLMSRMSEVELVQNFTGFGLYDQEVIQKLREIDDPYPYFRGLICDLGYARAEVPFTQPRRARGITKNNFYTLWDMAMLGITNHSKMPLRLSILTGFGLAGLSLLVALGYFVYKLLHWSSFQVGVAPLVIGIYFFASVQLIFIGILGEYVGSIHTQVLKRPLVIEKERGNFD